MIIVICKLGVQAAHCFLPCSAAPLAVDVGAKHGLSALQVQEDFSYGFIEQLNRTRAAEKVMRPHSIASPVLFLWTPCPADQLKA